ncbi:MAG: YopX family protein [Segatella sp.]
MSREILFRGQPTGKGGIWMVGIGAYKTHTAEHLVLNAKGDCVEVVHLCQYTGLKDKNGKKIFEGDIIKTPHGFIGEVVFGRAEEECTHMECNRKITDVYTTYGWIFKRADGYTCAIDDEILQGELLGNVIDNPELIK